MPVRMAFWRRRDGVRDRGFGVGAEEEEQEDGDEGG